jgi:hypothetical protein
MQSVGFFSQRGGDFIYLTLEDAQFAFSIAPYVE